MPSRNDKKFIYRLQLDCTKNLHSFFARHTKLVQNLKPLEVREAEEPAIAAAAA